MSLSEEQRQKMRAMAEQKRVEDDYIEYQDFLKFKAMKQSVIKTQSFIDSGNLSGCDSQAHYCKHCGAVIPAEHVFCHACSRVDDGNVEKQPYKVDWLDAPFFALAFVPLLSLVLNYLGLDLLWHWLILIFTNSVLCCLDIWLLRKNGYDVSYFAELWIFLIPWYIWRRIETTTENYWPLVVWSVCMLVSVLFPNLVTQFI